MPYKAFKGAYLTVDELEPIEQDYMVLGASIEQLMWRRIKIMNSSEQQFNQEYPATPLCSFISTGCNIFNSAKVQEQFIQRKNIERLTNIASLPTPTNIYIKKMEQSKVR